MKIDELINLASEKDPHFKKSYDYRINIRQKAPDLNWLIKNLERILTRDFVRKAALKELKMEYFEKHHEYSNMGSE